MDGVGGDLKSDWQPEVKHSLLLRVFRVHKIR